VRLALLLLLKLDGPLNGYQLIQGLQERSDGRWNPSPGSVYPALNQLEDEGLIKSAEVEGESGRAFELTPEGTSHIEELGEVKAPWESGGAHDDSIAQLWHGFGGLWRATKQIVADGDPAQIAKAGELLTQTRKQLYRILAGDEDQA
jgi:DNA-binding PadR family transcriptional regulator